MKGRKPIAQVLRAAAVLVLLCAYIPAAWAAQGDECAAGRHQYIETRRVAATATQDGEAVFVCEACGQTYTETLFASDHLWGPWTTVRRATCTQPGERRRTCSRGQRHDEYAAIPALGHDYDETLLAPGCEEEGALIFTCSRCKDTYSEPIPPIGHDYEEVIEVEPSCLEPGTLVFICKNNPEHTREERIPALGSHSFGEWREETPPGEGTQGLEARVCALCGFEEARPLGALPVPPGTVPALDIVLVGANAVSLVFFAFLLVPYFLCLLYFRRRRKTVKRRDALRKEVENRYEFK